MQLHYFDFVPPPGWNGFRAGAQVRLIPPNTSPADAEVAIIVSPLVPKAPGLPPADVLVKQTLEAETALTGATVTAQNGPMPCKSDHGLAGVSYDVTLRNAQGQIEHRLYVLLVDELCLYGLSYLANETAFPTEVDAFWKAVATIKPFSGKIVLPQGEPFGHFNE